MKKKIGCLHAHHSNIEYIQASLASDHVELVHFVDPGLMGRIAADQEFHADQAKAKVVEQVEWISQTKVDAILITCTNYIALLEEDRLTASVPIIKIDEPFFDSICNTTEPQVLIFTNPDTVPGTMRRLGEFAAAHEKSISRVETRIMENTFELMMQGKKEQYVEAVASYIKEVLAAENHLNVAVAQLSMVDSAKQVERELNITIQNPLNSLTAYMDAVLST